MGVGGRELGDGEEGEEGEREREGRYAIEQDKIEAHNTVYSNCREKGSTLKHVRSQKQSSTTFNTQYSSCSCSYSSCERKFDQKGNKFLVAYSIA